MKQVALKMKLLAQYTLPYFAGVAAVSSCANQTQGAQNATSFAYAVSELLGRAQNVV